MKIKNNRKKIWKTRIENKNKKKKGTWKSEGKKNNAEGATQ